MLIYLGILVCAFLSFAIVFGLAVNYTAVLAQRYRDAFTQEAGRNLSDMFIFINPGEIYLLNIAVLLISFAIVWLLTKAVGIALMVAVCLAMCPKLVWSKLRARRNQRFLLALPDAVMSIATMMRSGATLPVAMENMVAESRGPIAQEFGLFLRELRIGVEYHEALDNLVRRMPIEELTLVSAAMKISREVGGSLADVLYRLAETLRKKIEMEGKIRALTAQGKAQGYVMTGLPVLLAFVLMKMEPEAMARLFTDWVGWIVCAVFAVCMGLGYFFIKKIVTIDV